jgi:hypothetical protein
LSFHRLIVPAPPSRFYVQPDGIQRLQHGIMQISADTAPVFQEFAQPAFRRFERGR